MCLMFREKVDVVDVYTDWSVRSASSSFEVPAVIRLPDYSKPPPSHTKFCRENVYLRDSYRCQYCGRIKPPRNLTFDHVQPKSKGGRTTWTNIVTACYRCNHAKADRSPAEAGMRLISEPTMPDPREVRRRLFSPGGDEPEQWRVWLQT